VVWSGRSCFFSFLLEVVQRFHADLLMFFRELRAFFFKKKMKIKFQECFFFHLSRALNECTRNILQG
jgi:hypothetical protein